MGSKINYVNRALNTLYFLVPFILSYRKLTYAVSQTEEEQTSLLRLCNRKEIRNGKWQNVTLTKAPYNPHESKYHLWKEKPRNICGEESDYSKSKTWQSYEWIPAPDTKKCSFESFTKERFCKVANDLSQLQSSIKKPALAIIGDSLSWEHYIALGFSLGLDVDLYGQVESRLKHTNYEQFACDEKIRLAYRRSDFLAEVPDLIESFDPNIIVLNKGAHQQTEEEFIETLQSTLIVLEQWQASCAKSNRICWVFVRTSVPGHPHCKTFSKPVNDIKIMEEHIANRKNYKRKELAYGWFHFKEKNEIMLDMFEKSKVKFDVIDAYEINIRRPDLHTDCLHSCLPGKHDIYNQILLHYLKIKSKGIYQAQLRKASLITNV